MINLLKSLYPTYIDEQDIRTFIYLIENNNESVISAYEVFLLDNDLENLLETLAYLKKVSSKNTNPNIFNVDSNAQSVLSPGIRLAPILVKKKKSDKDKSYLVKANNQLTEIEEESHSQPQTKIICL